MALPLRQWPHDGLVEAIHQARARVGDERNLTRLTRLETHSRSRRNVEPISKSRLPVESESRVGLGEMIMTADLDRPVACVRHFERDGHSALVQDDLAGCWKNLARDHVSPARRA